MSESNPFRLFVTHAWEESEDYLRVFEFLEASDNFHYRNLSRPDEAAPADKEARRESLRGQIRPAEIVIALASLGTKSGEWLTFEMTFAQAARRPVLLLPAFGGSGPLPRTLTQLANDIGTWDERALLSKIRALARGESTGQWDVVEFKLD